MQTISAGHQSMRRALLAVVMIAAFAAGCGGSDSDDTATETATASQQQQAAAFKSGATAATAATTKIGTDLGAAIQSASSQTDAQLAATFTDLAARSRAVVADLNALDPPAASRAKVNALVGALSTGAQDLDAIATAARAGDAASAKSATETLVRDSPAIMAAKDALDADLGVKTTTTNSS